MMNYKNIFKANTDFEKGHLRVNLISFSIIVLSIFRQYIFPSMLINVNAIIGSIILIFGRRIGLYFYRINIFVSCFYFLFAFGMYFYTGIIWGLEKETFFYYVTELLLLLPANYFIRKDFCINAYLFAKSNKL